MKKSRLVTFNDYLALFVRLRWWVMGTTVALCGLTILIAMVLPKGYSSRTMLLIQPRDVPTDFVKDLMAGDKEERLGTIQQTVLSRTNLLRILGEFENQLSEYQNLDDEQKVARLLKRITIDFPTERKPDGKFTPVTNILISYGDQSPDRAQKITARLASLFIEQDNKARENKVFGTAEFFDAELKKASEELAKSEEALKGVKQRYRGETPADLETNLRTLDRLQLQKNANQEALDRFVTMQRTLELQVSETPPKIPGAVRPDLMGNTVHSMNIQNYRRKEDEYKALIVRAKPSHPDVRSLKAELELLRKALSPDELMALENKDETEQADQGMAPNPVYQNMISQLNSVRADIAIRQKEKQWVETEIAKCTRHIQNVPAAEQEIMAIMRINAELTKQHDDLKEKLEQAQLAGNLESSQKGAQFAVIDPANYPLTASTPGRKFILLVGFILSLGAGVAVALVINLFSQCIWTQHELERALEVPVFVEIPSIVSPSEARNARRKMRMQAAAGILGACIYCGVMVYLYSHQSAVVRLLDPVFEKIMERSAI